MVNRPFHPIPIVGQNRSPNPDGALDPAHATDCGEACISSVLRAFGAPSWSVGCVREAMFGPSALGYSNGQEIADFLVRCGLQAVEEDVYGPDVRPHLSSVADSDGLSVILGYWLGQGLLHWNVVGRPGPGGMWTMDPWYPARVLKTWATLEGQFGNQLVVVHGR